MDMPLFITPMMKAPTTAPGTFPTPPAPKHPPMKTAAITSNSKPTPALGIFDGLDQGRFSQEGTAGRRRFPAKERAS
jgi:hypothetical protein